ncbi:Fic family protein [Eubacteriales bacterium OttesenSCG-928-A19]|nr:Fic family protein [Eubacteriales bacterium OttesenSCG-928-A19]
MTIYEKIDATQAKINKLRPFEGHILKQLQDYYRIGLTWSSNALEGNTLTISETKVLLEDGLTVGGKPLRDALEAVGHADAYDFMFTLLGKHEITEQDILMMHHLFYRTIDEKNAGRYRDIEVFITGSSHNVCEVDLIQEEMTSLVAWANNERGNYHPVEFAAMLHKRFVFIHPFVDGNGRVARLFMNTALIQDSYMLAVIPPVLRQEYIAALEQAHTDDKPFVAFIADRVYESQKEIIRLLHIK